MKKNIGVFLSLMGLAIFSGHAFNSGGVEYRQLEGERNACEVVYSENYIGVVTIPPTVTYGGATYNVVSIGSYAFAGCEAVTGVEIPATVASVGRNAFQGCVSLSGMKWPESIKEISTQTFYGCGSLQSFSGPGVSVINPTAFGNCTSLSQLQTGSLTKIGERAFLNCRAIDRFEMPSGLTLEEAVFSGCSGLRYVSLPEDINSIPAYTFYGCSSLETVENLMQAENIGDYAFYTCSALENIRLGRLKTLGKNAFGICSSLDINIIEGDDLTLGAYAFTGCMALKDIQLNGVVKIEEEAFSNAEHLEKIRFDSAMHTISARAFLNCNRIKLVECNAQQPPFMQNNAFTQTVYDNATLVVPEGKALLYRQWAPWSYFIHVQESESTAVSVNKKEIETFAISTENNQLKVNGEKGVVRIYDMSGVMIDSMTKDEDGIVFNLPFPGVYTVTLNNEGKKFIIK